MEVKNTSLTGLQQKIVSSIYKKVEELNQLIKNASNENLVILMEIGEGGMMSTPYPRIRMRSYSQVDVVETFEPRLEPAEGECESANVTETPSVTLGDTSKTSPYEPPCEVGE